MTHKAVILNSEDNVATALAQLKTGDTLDLEISGEIRAIKLTNDIPFGHKFSIAGIAPDSPVIKYGEVIGIATTTIAPGDYVHVHNVVSARGRGDLSGDVK